MSMSVHRVRRHTVAAVLAAGLALTGVAACGQGSSPGGRSSTAASAASGEAAVFPLTVSNCGAQVTFEQAPERVVLLKSASVPYLAALGVLDRVVAKAGQYPREYYDEQTLAALDKIPTLTDKLDPTGHLHISKEVVIAQEPDLVLGVTETVNHKTLASSKIPLLEEPAFCTTGAKTKPTIDTIADQTTLYGKVFGRTEQAATANEELRARVKAITAKVPDRKGATGAVLYPTVGGGVTYAYGNRSMADPLLTLAGFANVFGDVDDRVFEVSPEQILAKNPDVIVLLHSDGATGPVKQALATLPGADRLRALREGHVLVQLLNFVEPPSPLAVTGLEHLVGAFEKVP